MAVCNNDVILGLRKFIYCDSMIENQTNTTIKKVLLFFVIVLKFSMRLLWVSLWKMKFDIRDP